MSDTGRKEVKKYFRHFRGLFIFLGVVLIPFVILYISRSNKADKVAEERQYYASPNTERVYQDRRVFDFADKLTEEEEMKLEDYIYKAEQRTLTDIVIVTLNQTLADFEPEYRAAYSIPVTPDKYVMVFADKFWEDNRFGYDAPQVLDGTTNTGDGVILVDNLFREPETGKIHTWMGTTGIVEETFSSYMIDNVLDSFYYDVDRDYYKACITFIDSYEEQFNDMFSVSVPRLGHFLAILIGIIIFLIYFFMKRREILGITTVTDETYLVDGTLKFEDSQDIFLRKETSRHYNPPSSSSSGGGGGHHSSGGGGSHGGGGHSR